MGGAADPRARQLVDGAAALGVELLPAAADRLVAYLDLIYQSNGAVNLTRVPPGEAVERHLLDSLAGLRSLANAGVGRRVVDVGTGAGFPGVALAAARPGWHVDLVEAARKKAEVVARAAAAAGIPNVRVVWDRAETLAHQEGLRAGFDVAAARGVAALPVLAELTLPFLRPGGVLLAYKGPAVDDEVARAAGALDVLGGTVAGIDRFELPWSRAERAIVIVEKVGPTPEAYPRRPGVPARRPLDAAPRRGQEGLIGRRSRGSGGGGPW